MNAPANHEKTHRVLGDNATDTIGVEIDESALLFGVGLGTSLWSFRTRDVPEEFHLEDR